MRARALLKVHRVALHVLIQKRVVAQNSSFVRWCSAPGKLSLSPPPRECSEAKTDASQQHDRCTVRERTHDDGTADGISLPSHLTRAQRSPQGPLQHALQIADRPRRPCTCYNSLLLSLSMSNRCSPSTFIRDSYVRVKRSSSAVVASASAVSWCSVRR